MDDSCFIGNIYQKQVGNDSLPVLVDSFGKLGTQVSSRRFKHDIKPMEKASEAILALKPVTFHYKSDSAGKPQFGLIAEEVAEVNPDLVVRDAEGRVNTVRYEQNQRHVAERVPQRAQESRGIEKHRGKPCSNAERAGCAENAKE